MSVGLCRTCAIAGDCADRAALGPGEWMATCFRYVRAIPDETRLDELERRVERIERLLNHKGGGR